MTGSMLTAGASRKDGPGRELLQGEEQKGGNGMKELPVSRKILNQTQRKHLNIGLEP